MIASYETMEFGKRKPCLQRAFSKFFELCRALPRACISAQFLVWYIIRLLGISALGDLCLVRFPVRILAKKTVALKAVVRLTFKEKHELIRIS